MTDPLSKTKPRLHTLHLKVFRQQHADASVGQMIDEVMQTSHNPHKLQRQQVDTAAQTFLNLGMRDLSALTILCGLVLQSGGSAQQIVDAHEDIWSLAPTTDLKKARLIRKAMAPAA